MGSRMTTRKPTTSTPPVAGTGTGDAPAQRTEDFVGPYALQDFTLYHVTRYGLRPSRVAFLAWRAWRMRLVSNSGGGATVSRSRCT